jgi:hypothetical protein
MSAGQDLVADLLQSEHEHEQALRDFVQCGREAAHAEREYRVALAKEIASLRSDGVAWSSCTDMAKGDLVVAEQRCLRDIAEVMYKAAGERIQHIKRKRDILRAFWEREWGHE